jgi:uncharacterized protein (DUF952 family)
VHRIFHISSQADWTSAQAAGEYRVSTLGRTLDEEGFIHCSTLAQVAQVANTFYRGQRGLVLLGIDPGLVRAEIRCESPDGGPVGFPHVYGPINTDAVVEVTEFEPGPDGEFTVGDREI